MEDTRTFAELLKPLSATVQPKRKIFSVSGRDMPPAALNTLMLRKSSKLSPKRSKRGA